MSMQYCKLWILLLSPVFGKLHVENNLLMLQFTFFVE